MASVLALPQLLSLALPPLTLFLEFGEFDGEG